MRRYVEDESYWKRRACLRWKSCDVDSHGGASAS
jgi:hypothetical protein